jgi:hypothetical protein
MDTDHHEAFDRKKIKGRVSQHIKAPSYFENISTRPSSSASSVSPSSASGVVLGGEIQRNESNLLNLTTDNEMGH